jgi:trehalose synthase
MSPLTPVTIGALPPDRFEALLGDAYGEVAAGIERAHELFGGRVIWHLNSTARGGGVVELLTSLLAYARGAGVDTRWLVIDAPQEFFAITKRIHNNLHGSPGDGGELGAGERRVYERVAEENAGELASLVKPSDIVFLHDPQTAGMIGSLLATGTRIVWRCHVGLDLPNDLARRAWDFLRPDVERAHAYVFSRREFVWHGLDESKVWIVPPSVDAFAPKNQELDRPTVAAILAAAGIEVGEVEATPTFTREDGTPGRVDRRAELIGGPLPPGASLVTQVSRWDRLKDPEGVLRCFAEQIDEPRAHLLLAGPDTRSVRDDPEGAEVLAEVTAQRESLPGAIAERIHLASLPMDDVEENAAMVNAIQRRSDVVVQKSIAEGFGLTVAEAMWKGRPVVASRAGGIQDQIVDGESGVLIDDPRDLEAFAKAIEGLLADPGRASEIGDAARERVRAHFLGTRQLIQYLRLLDRLMGA